MTTAEFNRKSADLVKQSARGAGQLFKKDAEILFFFADYARNLVGDVFVGSYIDKHNPELMKSLMKLSLWQGLHDQSRKAPVATRLQAIQGAEEDFVQVQRLLTNILRDRVPHTEKDALMWHTRNKKLLMLADEIMFRAPPDGVYRMRWRSLNIVNPWLVLDFCAMQMHHLIERADPLLYDPNMCTAPEKLAAIIEKTKTVLADIDMERVSEKSCRAFDLPQGAVESFEYPMRHLGQLYIQANNLASTLDRGKAPKTLFWLAETLHSIASTLILHTPPYRVYSEEENEAVAAERLVVMDEWKRQGRSFG